MTIKRGETVKIIFQTLLIVGTFAIASTSPYFGIRLMQGLMRDAKRRKKFEEKINNKDKERFRSAFYSLKRKGLIEVKYRGNQIYISLTKEGKKRAGRYKIDNLQIKKPNNWDKKWRVLIFDIQDKQRIKREALRGKIKELGLYQLQKSVWVYPYDFQNEMVILRDFFGLLKSEMKIITAVKVEDDELMRTFFKLS